MIAAGCTAGADAGPAVNGTEPGQAATDDRTEDEVVALLGGEWFLQDGTLQDSQIDPVDGAAVTLVLLPEDCYDDVPCWTGTDGCNTYTVTVEWGGGDEYHLSGHAVDDMRCTPDRVHDVAAQYKQALTQTSSVAFEGDNLVLEGDHARLRYARHSPQR